MAHQHYFCTVLYSVQWPINSENQNVNIDVQKVIAQLRNTNVRRTKYLN